MKPVPGIKKKTLLYRGTDINGDFRVNWSKSTGRRMECTNVDL